MSGSDSRNFTWWRGVRWFVLYPVLVFCLFHGLLTGSPIPLWHLESLDNPVEVSSITERQLVLGGGTKLSLPYIEEIPVDDRLFRAAISEGIEIKPDGNVIGLIWVDRICGNDPYVGRRLKVNLSYLAGAINPLGIDDDIVPRDVQEFFLDRRIDSKTGRSHKRQHLDSFDFTKIRRIKEQIEYSIAQAADENEED